MSTRSSQRRLIIMFWPNYNMFSVFCFFFFSFQKLYLEKLVIVLHLMTAQQQMFLFE